MNKPVAVLKIGGGFLGDYKTVSMHLPEIKKIILEYQKQYKVVLVISALAGESRKLKKIANNLFKEKDLKDKDFILSQGEIFSTQLVSQYLNFCDVSAEALIGDKLPIVTNNNFSNADVLEVKTEFIKNCLEKNTIPAVPAFIGKTLKNEITTLGFDGSDTSAVAVACALKAKECFLFKDVDGIYTANPRRVEKAKKIDFISYEHMFVYALLGSKGVIHPKAVEKAAQNNLDVTVLPFFKKDNGSLITKNDSSDSKIIGITYSQEEKHIIISIVGDLQEQAGKKFVELLEKYNIEITATKSIYPLMNLSFVLKDENKLDKTLSLLHTYCGLDSDKLEKSKIVNIEQTYFDPVFGG